MRLFACCFTALVATSFGFILRALSLPAWGRELNLTATQQGEIFGAGLWPFAIGIVLFSLVIDRIGYRTALAVAFVCHVASAVVTINARGYWSLYTGTFLVGIANGCVEAVVNPVVATVFRRDKTKWLNILHAGWPAGLVLGGLLVMALGPDTSWRLTVGLIAVPTLAYGVLMIGVKFPVSERVAAGVPYRDMLREPGALGALVVVALVVFEVGRVFALPLGAKLAATAALTAAYAAYARAWGRPMFILLLVLMIPLATTELGTDGWITTLLEPEMAAMGLHPGWVIVYTSAIMMVLRLVSGPIVHKLSPLGVLAISSVLAAGGLVFLSRAAGFAIVAAATLYALGKTFLWPTMLGVVAERFPRGGALTLNATGGVGMLGAGVVGSVFLGAMQDRATVQALEAHDASLAAAVTVDAQGLVGGYRAIDAAKVATASPRDRAVIEAAGADSKKRALASVVWFPVAMLTVYTGLIVYFGSRGGYRAVVLPTVDTREVQA